jgi:hypothetical protein
MFVRGLIWFMISIAVFCNAAVTTLVLKLSLCACAAFFGIIVGSIFDKPFPESNWRHDIPSTLGAIIGALGSAWVMFF